MAKFNIMHCVPHERMHGLNGYKEVIDSVLWGLSELGHEVRYSLNTFDPTSRNIIFGAQVLPVEFLQTLPTHTIVYNFEQLRGLQKNQIKPELHLCAERFTIWEYSESNFESWALLGVDKPVLVPVGYAPVLSRIPKPAIQDLDILIYGMSGDKRVNAFHRLSHAGFKVLFVSGLYGEFRDALISRSKIVLNVNLYDLPKIFEIVRVSYLLANKKAVVAMLDPGTAVEKDLNTSVRFTVLEKIANDCAQLLEDDSERTRLEMLGYETFIQRDIKKILQHVLG